MDEEANGPLAQGHTAGLHAAGGFKPGRLPPKIVSLHGAKGSSGLVVDWGLDERERDNPEMVLTWRIQVCMEGNGFKWALCSRRQLNVIRRREGSGPQWGLLHTMSGLGTLDALSR